MLLVALLASLTLGDWNERLNERYGFRSYSADQAAAKKAEQIASEPKYRDRSVMWWGCFLETKAAANVTDIEKMIIMEEYEGQPLTPMDVKHLKVIQLDWKTKEAEAHKRCLGLY